MCTWRAVNVLLRQTIGTVFRCALADVPLKKSAQVSGNYQFQPPPGAQKIALRVTDVLGEETIIVKKIGDSV